MKNIKRYTNKKFNSSKCKKCIWLNKVNNTNYYCMFSKCIKEKGDNHDK